MQVDVVFAEVFVEVFVEVGNLDLFSRLGLLDLLSLFGILRLVDGVLRLVNVLKPVDNFSNLKKVALA